MIDWSTGKIRPPDELIRDGVIKNNRGQYWHKNTRELTGNQGIELGKSARFHKHETTDERLCLRRTLIDRETEEEARYYQDIRVRRRQEFPYL